MTNAWFFIVAINQRRPGVNDMLDYSHLKNKIVRKGRTFHATRLTFEREIYYVFTLPPLKANIKNWDFHLTQKGLSDLIVDQCYVVSSIFHLFQNDPDPRKKFETFLPFMWDPVAKHFTRSPLFRVPTCHVNKIIPFSQPRRILHCPTLLNRELLVDVIIRTPTEFLKIELRLKLKKNWMKTYIWSTHSQRSSAILSGHPPYQSRLVNH